MFKLKFWIPGYRNPKQMKQQKCWVGTLNATDVLLIRANKKTTIKRSYAPHNRSDIAEASGNETASRFNVSVPMADA